MERWLRRQEAVKLQSAADKRTCSIRATTMNLAKAAYTRAT
jgi:hypothetical protein